MTTKLHKLPNSRIKLEIIVPMGKTAEYFDRAYEKLASTINIQGFRPGKAPKLMTLEAIGQNRYNSEALNMALADTYFQVIKTQKLIPITQPAIAIKDFQQGKDMSYTAEVDIYPKISLGAYKEIKVKHQAQKFLATDLEVDKIIKRLRYQAAKFTESKDTAQKDKRVEIEFEGFIKNAKVDKYCSKNYPLILGENVLIAGFEDKLVGMKKDEAKEFDLTVQKDKVHFKVKLLDIKDVKSPELNEEFAKKFGHKNAEGLKSAIKKNIVLEKEMRDRQILQEKVFDELLKKIKMEVPASLMDQEIARKIAEIQAKMGPGFEEFLKKSGKNLADLRKEMTPQAENAVKIGLILGEVAKDLQLAKERPKTEEEQRKIVRKTIDKLVEIATK